MPESDVSGRSLKERWLRAQVHLDAFRSNPADYLTAVKSRLLGLRLRSRHQFSALLGHSPRAYDLWMASREPARLAALPTKGRGDGPQIVAVIDCRQSSHGCDRSIAALQAAGSDRIVALGADHPAGATTVLDDVVALADYLVALGDETVWVLPVQPGDRVSPVAIGAYRAAIEAAPGASRIYADDDLIDDADRRHSPHFKPVWNAELVRHLDYVTGASVFACDPRQIGQSWPAGEQAGSEPVRLPHVLHHRRSRPEARLAEPAAPCDRLPHVTVIVPTRDGEALLRKCMEGLAATRYPSFDCMVIDNASADPGALAFLQELEAGGATIIREPGAFNYAGMHNRAVSQARGEVLCLLNNDIEMIGPDWLERMVVHAIRDDVGAVGAKLLYPDGTIQHAGVVTGIGGGAAHAHRLQEDSEPGYFSRAHLPQFVSAVTAACLVVERRKFEAVGGFDAENFAVAFNDVDLCLKLNRAGWQSFYEPRAVLIHHESKSRGRDDTEVKRKRFAGELAALKQRWHTDTQRDPYHHPELSVFSEHFVVSL
ncbi:glycosyltransferase family 2 protein [Croceibacterium ferulae]|uniref:glycosyltransferase family 2 protein n=1 Tax=Croceibacterium ferulae TaxID=1854641 RepID=UPI001F4EF148|nr:glycosyltransferase family 2 protein [Croceibacterium ferulae]